MMLGGASGACKLVRASRFLIALGVILIGICAALPFRQSQPRALAPPSAPVPLVLTLRRPDAPLELGPRVEVSPAVGLHSDAARAPLAAAGSAPLTPAAALDNLAPPPALPVSFQPSASAESTNNWQPAPVAKPTAAPPRPRPYRLRDGDTLENVADRYLGDRGRANEIFEANRDVLARPDLLPVGVTIQLPPRRAVGELEPVAAER
jgi:phage tail protein X